MSESALNSETADRNHLSEVLERIQRLANELAAQLKSQPCSPDIVDDIRSYIEFIDGMRTWCAKLPKQRLYEAAFALLRQIDRLLRKSAESGIVLPNFPCSVDKTLTTPSLIDIAVLLGPPIKVSTDNMAAFVCVPVGLNHVWTPAGIKQALERNLITHGIDNTQLAKSLDDKWIGKFVSAAFGRLPESGKNAVLLNCTQLPIPIFETNNGDGKTAENKARFFQPVQTKSPILKKIPATQGERGYDVFGNDIPSTPGLDRSFPQIPNCIVNPDGKELWSVVNGFAYSENDQLRVSPSLIVKGNVDYESGTVRSMVAITVLGDVKTGFQVASGSDIAVEGSIEAAEVEAKGTIFCHGGIDGGKKTAVISAGKNLYAKHIRSAEVNVENAVIVHGPVEHAIIGAKQIAVLGEDGRIVGGRIKAWHDVCATEIGSQNGEKTQVVLGTELSALRTTMDELKRSMEEKEEKRRECMMILKTCQTMKFGKTAAEMEKLKFEITQLNEEMKPIQKEISLLSKDISESESTERMVRVKKAVYPGTEIRILGRTLNVRDKIGATTIIMKEGKLITTPYRERPE